MKQGACLALKSVSLLLLITAFRSTGHCVRYTSCVAARRFGGHFPKTLFSSLFPLLKLRGGQDADTEEILSTKSNDPNLPNCNIVFIGHVDAGKSTISGHLLYLSGNLDQRTLEKFEREAKALGRESWKFAWAMDTTDEERAKGKTQECGRATFSSSKRHYTILDAPGHKNFVPNMIGGASQAEIAILVVSAKKGEFESGFEKGGQTREHAVLVKTTGVRHIIVAINKLDEVQWDKERFDEIVTKLSPFLKQTGFNLKTDVTFLPVDGLHGVNLQTRMKQEMCGWYQGSSLIEVLDSLELPKRWLDLPLRMPVTERYKESDVYVMGKIESGTLAVGDDVIVMPNQAEGSVLQIFMEEQEVSAAAAGDNVRVRVRGWDEDLVHVGHMICKRPPASSSITAQGATGVAAVARPVRRFEARVNILDYKTIICPGFECILHVHAAVVPCRLGRIISLVASKASVPGAPAGGGGGMVRFLRPGQSAIVELEVDESVCVEEYRAHPQLGRFILREEGATIGIGVVTNTSLPPPT